ncbi:MAG: hypothetical protein J3Q66DRAFT_398253 [Benniella sp.]|nr:MAG: hypothetical protein J3Q66DRAFT_398253 [Benniella sp.]
MLELTRQFTTAVSNLWEGPLYAKLQDHLLSVLLRIHLAPIREQRNMDKRKKFAKSIDGTQAQTTDTTQTADTTQITDSTQSATQSITATLVTQAAMPTQAAQIRMSRSEIKWKTKELCDELSDVWRKGTETEKQASRVRGILKQLLKLKNRTPDLSPRNNQDSSLHPMGLEDDQDDGEPENDEDQGNIANKDQKRKDAKGDDDKSYRLGYIKGFINRQEFIDSQGAIGSQGIISGQPERPPGDSQNAARVPLYHRDDR